MKGVKARLTVRGFKDLQGSSLATFAGTTSRWGQRMVLAVAAMHKWALFSADVGAAFLKGLTFDKLAALTGEPLRQVAFTPPTGSEDLFREMPGFAKIDFNRYVLKLLRPGFGLKDAPRAWKIALDGLFTKIGGQKLNADKQIFFWRKGGKLIGILSCHVDDLKGAGEEAWREMVLKAVRDEFGELSTSMYEFTHCGIKHQQHDDYSITIHQNHYIAGLRTVNIKPLEQMADTAPLDDVYKASFLTILGALSWCTMTRYDINVYVSALQRVAKEPQKQHLIKCNTLVKWLRRKDFKTLFRCIPKPWKIMVISDAAFKKDETTGLSVRGALIGISTKNAMSPGGPIAILEGYARKQKRVTRSTLSSETHAAIDAYDLGRMISMGFEQLLADHSFDPKRELNTVMRDGPLTVPVELAIDCCSLFDAARNTEGGKISEQTLVFAVEILRQDLRLDQVLAALYWVNTLDMTADAMTKGSVARKAVIEVLAQGVWKLAYACKRYSLRGGLVDLQP